MTLKVSSDAHGFDQPITCFGEFQLDRQLRTLRRGAEHLKLSAKPFATLEFLIENRCRVVAKTELLREVWGGQQEINTVEQAVRQVRKALEDDPSQPRYIETVPGQGYRFIAVAYSPTPAGTAAGVIPLHPSRRKLLYAAVTGSLIVCSAGLAARSLLHRPRRVVRVTVGAGSVVALDGAGHVLWTYELGRGFAAPPIPEALWRTQGEDIDGDGVPEVLVAAYSADPSRTEELFCFSASGRVLWRYRPQVDVDLAPQA